MAFALQKIRNQEDALRILVALVQKGIEDPVIVSVARKIVQGCPARNDECELQALYDAVKTGTPAIRGLEKGLRYVSDPHQVDWFQGAVRTLKQCELGACAGDCDEHSVLIAALAGAIGFSVGLRVWGHESGTEYEHIYACAGFPKLDAPADPREWLGLDTTEKQAFVGWDPPRGRWATAIAAAAGME